MVRESVRARFGAGGYVSGDASLVVGRENLRRRSEILRGQKTYPPLLTPGLHSVLTWDGSPGRLNKAGDSVNDSYHISDDIMRHRRFDLLLEELQDCGLTIFVQYGVFCVPTECGEYIPLVEREVQEAILDFVYEKADNAEAIVQMINRCLEEE